MATGEAEAVALNAEQTRALFDILTHHETYAEIEEFKTPDAVTNYGFPFARVTVPDCKGEGAGEGGQDGIQKGEDEEEEKSTSPLLQMLLTRLILPFPGVRDFPRDFWAVRVQGMLVRFGEASLSESYDKGAMGTRKTLATGSSSVIEMVARGSLGGVEDMRKKQTTTETETETEAEAEKEGERLMGEYDDQRAEDLERAWEDVVQEWVYGDLTDDVFDYLSRTDDVEAHSPAVKAAVDYAIIHLATFAHHIFILSPKGQYLLKLLENINSLVPYKMIKQTLRIGNAATMITGMMRLLLAKLSVASVTNWFGLTASADDGMNLLQRIIALVLSWDASEFRKSAERVEKAREDAPREEVLLAIRRHVGAGRGEHEAVRAASVEKSQSIIVAILNASDLSSSSLSLLTEAQHAQCLEYYSALLSVHDREAITSVLCRQPPDLFTHSLKDIIAAYDTMIRSVHSRVDLRKYLEAMQAFVSDFIHASEPKKARRGEAERMASVEDYVRLLRRNRALWWGWIHALANRCPDVWEAFRVWTKDIAVKFRQDEGRSMGECLNHLFASLDPETQEPVLAAINAHAAYLADLGSLSQSRLQRIITSTSSSPSPASEPDNSNSNSNSNNHKPKNNNKNNNNNNNNNNTPTTSGPGLYLSRWQDILDSTPITPSTAPSNGSSSPSLRHGRDVKHISTMGKLGLGGKRLGAEGEARDSGPRAPDVRAVVEALGEGFRDVVRKRSGGVRSWVNTLPR